MVEDFRQSFWRDAFALKGAVTLAVSERVLIFGLISLVICLIDYRLHPTITRLGIEVAPYEVAGAALALLLLLRTNAGYDRWWEGRKLWGGITNQSRSLTIAALAYGPDDSDWRDRVVRWTAAFAHAARHSLRGEREVPKIAALLGDEAARGVAASEHMPGFVALTVARILREGCDRLEMDRFGFLQADRARAELIDLIGGCERIRKTPLPRAYAINIRRFITLFLTTLPFALLTRAGGWLTTLVVVLVAYPILALDQIGNELQNPFDPQNLGHLPLDEICETIERNLLALRDADPGRATVDGRGPGPLKSGSGHEIRQERWHES
ncbi:MAG: hypothetical protein JOZ63_15270 [Planctomycetaceae bacterium]|nr:hypothetical protein [Planctomycetaceae bacterium]